MATFLPGDDVGIIPVDFSTGSYVAFDASSRIFTAGVDIGIPLPVDYATASYVAFGPGYTVFTSGTDIGLPLAVDYSTPWTKPPASVVKVFDRATFSFGMHALPPGAYTYDAHFGPGQEITFNAPKRRHHIVSIYKA